MVRSKIFASIVGLASLAVIGVASAEPTELTSAQMDSVTAAGTQNNGNGKKFGLIKQTNLVVQSNVSVVNIEDSYVKGPIITVQINNIGNLKQVNVVD
jgi:hypothetical protein